MTSAAIRAIKPALAREPRSEEVVANVLRAESEAIAEAQLSVAPAAARAAELIAAHDQPVFCVGVGKSGLVAAKVAATLSSLAIPAFFVHAGEAAHGDLGAVGSGSIVLLFSNSGSTEEILRILPSLAERGCRLVGIVGRLDSPIAARAEIVVPATVRAEADGLGLAPTASTTLQMAIGDAIAVAASRIRGASREDFLRQHPAGLLGRQLVPISGIMRMGADLPVVLASASIAELLAVMSAKRMGAVCVTDHGGNLLGLIVDGDIRRHIQARRDLYSAAAGEIMRADPVTVRPGATLGDVLGIVRETGGLLVMPVTDEDGRLLGLVHVNDLLTI
ncbi:KpsF/GutQ family sugar-phosphate isomerase [Sphingomonas sp. MAH-20]|uniref:KpsF/GutQ family sugar-phosphate isomerase n=1 Tax=Sphingomonas horti TaxID=2682842 RepID=A0A6I4IXT3_9SPHN|nr:MULTISPECIES: KpsF/GutQ family sugar-phosphate isomerase [Sphingomonas]MBA2920526.1 KpsF/GutQ family sugar-phosphate isomerase [Sphingomonas sp. CGMCC 1.13658]MVO76778.1 KpsF/GutQ family sugar-phosphate isomerase [Sphingomonas horti]